MNKTDKSTPSPSSIVLQQCNDLIHLQEVLLNHSMEKQRESLTLASENRKVKEDCETLHRQLQEESIKHAETRAELIEERDKMELAETEIRVLRKQLDREKTTFNEAFGLLKNQALADSSKAESLLTRCTGMEALCAKKDEELAAQMSELKALQKKMEKLKLAHKMEVQELNLRVQQEMYLANNVTSSAPTSRVTKTAVRTKRKK